MNPYYEKIAQLGPPTSFFEILCIVTFICAASLMFWALYEGIKGELELRRLTLKEFIAWILGWPYIKKWLQNTFFLFTDDEWNEKQHMWLKKRQEERKEVEVEDTWLKERLREEKRLLKEEKRLLMESAKASLKTDKAMAKYECGDCGYKDQQEMSLYAEIVEAAKTFCYKEICQKCKSRKLKIVMIECKLFERKR